MVASVIKKHAPSEYVSVILRNELFRIWTGSVSVDEPTDVFFDRMGTQLRPHGLFMWNVYAECTTSWHLSTLKIDLAGNPHRWTYTLPSIERLILLGHRDAFKDRVFSNAWDLGAVEELIVQDVQLHYLHQTFYDNTHPSVCCFSTSGEFILTTITGPV